MSARSPLCRVAAVCLRAHSTTTPAVTTAAPPRPPRTKSSTYTGVSYHTARGHYEAYVGVNGRKVSCGAFDAEADAAVAADALRYALHGPSAPLNLPSRLRADVISSFLDGLAARCAGGASPTDSLLARDSQDLRALIDSLHLASRRGAAPTSRYIGVYRILTPAAGRKGGDGAPSPTPGPWVAYVNWASFCCQIGRFHTEDDAMKAYDVVSRVLFGCGEGVGGGLPTAGRLNRPGDPELDRLAKELRGATKVATNADGVAVFPASLGSTLRAQAEVRGYLRGLRIPWRETRSKKSRFRGVTRGLGAVAQPWLARLHVGGVAVLRSWHKSEEEAARAYDAAVALVGGAGWERRCNFPPPVQEAVNKTTAPPPEVM